MPNVFYLFMPKRPISQLLFFHLLFLTTAVKAVSLDKCQLMKLDLRMSMRQTLLNPQAMEKNFPPATFGEKEKNTPLTIALKYLQRRANVELVSNGETAINRSSSAETAKLQTKINSEINSENTPFETFLNNLGLELSVIGNYGDSRGARLGGEYFPNDKRIEVYIPFPVAEFSPKTSNPKYSLMAVYSWVLIHEMEHFWQLENVRKILANNPEFTYLKPDEIVALLSSDLKVRYYRERGAMMSEAQFLKIISFFWPEILTVEMMKRELDPWVPANRFNLKLMEDLPLLKQWLSYFERNPDKSIQSYLEQVYGDGRHSKTR